METAGIKKREIAINESSSVSLCHDPRKQGAARELISRAFLFFVSKSLRGNSSNPPSMIPRLFDDPNQGSTGTRAGMSIGTRRERVSSCQTEGSRETSTEHRDEAWP
jgi:hypothetical protein